MSEIREKLIGPKNVRSKIIQVVLLSIVLITAFAFSTLLINLLFGGLREVPSTRLDDAEYKYRDTAPIPIPFDLEDLLALFQSLDIDVTPEMLETLLDMYDGDFDDIPLEDLSALMAAMLFSDVEVFRVYNYTDFNEMDTYLWKYECFDRYVTGTWSASVGENTYDFYTYNEYLGNPDLNPEILYIKMLNMTPDAGENQFTLPTLFSTPYLMENSFSAANIDPSSLILRKQIEGLNGTALRASFTASSNTNLTYNLVGESLPSDATLDADSMILTDITSPSAEYTALTDHYLQLDGGSLVNFISNHPDFATHYNYLANNVINSTDNAFIIADKIRNYLQYNFNFSYNPVPDTEADQDPINWFCKSQEGIYTEFASTFVALTRAFGVASRFIDGFNSRFIEQISDPIDGIGFAVKYQNIYSWSEIFIPTDIYGNGYWAQIDVLFENYLSNPPIPIFGNGSFLINVTCNGYEYDDFPTFNIDDTVVITATLTNDSLPIENETIYFTDITMGTSLGYDITDINGEATISVPLNSSILAGAHLIAAQYTPQVIGYGNYNLNKSISINLTSISPSAINVSDPTNNTIRVQGFIYDTLTSEGVPFSLINITLSNNETGLPVINPFTPLIITAEENGYFDAYLQGNEITIPKGDYNVSAMIYGVYNYTIIRYGYPVYFPIFPLNPINMSQTKSLHVDKEFTGNLWFLIDGVPSNYPYLPPNSTVITRGSTIMLEAQVIDEFGYPLENVTVEFYNYTGGDTFIGSNKTDVNGIATINAYVGYACITGPNLLYAKAGRLYNYSYYILNENPNITVISGPTPLVINKTESDTFYIAGYLNDSTNSAPLRYSDVELRIFRGTTDYTNFLDPLLGNNPFPVDNNGKFNVTFGVDPLIPPGNYTLRLYFNGTFDLTSYPNYPYDFNLPYISTSIILDHELQITYAAPTILNFWINGTASDNFTDPSISRDEELNLTVRLMNGDVPKIGETVQFWDETNNTYIGSRVTDSNGYASIIYSTNFYTIAGPHLLNVSFSSYSNYSYFILDEPININLEICPIPNEINSTTNIGRTFTIIGELQDLTNGLNIPYGRVEIRLYDGLTEYYYYLIPVGGSQQVSYYFYCNETGEILALFNVSSSIPQNNYTVTVNFTGMIFYNHLYYPHVFNLTSLSTSVICTYELNVTNPYDATIQLNVNTNPVPQDGIYPDGSGNPQTLLVGENVTFDGYIFQYGGPASGTASLYDVYTDPFNPIITVDLESGGYYFIQLNTSDYTQFHSGLHLIKIVYNSYINDVFNSTYLIINDTFTIDISSSDLSSYGYELIRDGVGFTVSGTCFDGIYDLRGLNVTLHLINDLGQDVSQYLEFSGDNYYIIGDDGSYSFDINRITIDCPQGSYSLRVFFNGSIYRTQDIPLLIGISGGAMTSVSSSSMDLNITARTYFNSGASTYYTAFLGANPISWIDGDTLFVEGQLLWDNNTGVSNVFVNLTVKLIIDGEIIAFNSTITTDSSGNFIGTIDVDEKFQGIDEVSETIIYVSFIPADNNLQNVEQPPDEVYN